MVAHENLLAIALLAPQQPRLLPISELPYAVEELSRMCASVNVPITAERSRFHRALALAQSIGAWSADSSTKPYHLATTGANMKAIA